MSIDIHGGSATQDINDPIVENIYQAMQSELAVRLPNTLPWVLPIIVTVDFLPAFISGFFILYTT